jgi:hypothetical protein
VHAALRHTRARFLFERPERFKIERRRAAPVPASAARAA